MDDMLSLKYQVPTRFALEVLGITPPHNALPVTIQCPVCHGQRPGLTIHNDPIQGGEWAYCEQCFFAGDMIKLVNSVWKGEIRTTARELFYAASENTQQALDPAMLENYYEAAVLRPQRLQDLWARCVERHVSPGVAKLWELQHRFQCTIEELGKISLRDAFVGCVRCKDLFAAMRVNQGIYERKRHLWEHALIMQLHDMPGRVSGFMLIGGDTQFPQDVVRITVPGHRGAGLGMTQLLQRSRESQHFGKYIVAANPCDALLLQSRHRRNNDSPLPVIFAHGATDCRIADIATWLPAARPIFWGEDRILALRTANNMLGDIVSCTSQLFYDRQPSRCLDHLMAAAVPWATALQRALKEMDNLQIVSLLRDLGVYDKRLDSFIATCEEPLQLKLTTFFATNRRTFRTPLGDETIVERDSGWYTERGDLISDAVIRIRQVIAAGYRGTYYNGDVQFRGCLYPFSVRAADVDRDLFSWVFTFLRDKMKAGLYTYAPNWASRGVAVAMAVHTPEYKTGPEYIGWDDESRKFVTPNFSIGPGGVVEEDVTPPTYVPQFPAINIPSPGDLPDRYLTALSAQTPETAFFWAMAAAVISNIVAPAVNRNQKKILLDGIGAQHAGGILSEKMGCPEIILTSAKTRSQLKRHPATTRWPAVIDTAALDTYSWLNTAPPYGDIYMLPQLVNRILAIRKLGVLVRCDAPLVAYPVTCVAAGHVVSGYLRELYQQKLSVFKPSGFFTLRVLRDLRRWFVHSGGHGDVFDMAKTYLPWATLAGRSQAVFELLEASGVADETPEGVWIDRRKLLTTLLAETGITVADDATHLLLQKANALVPGTTTPTGWCVKKQWWFSQGQRRDK